MTLQTVAQITMGRQKIDPVALYYKIGFLPCVKSGKPILVLPHSVFQPGDEFQTLEGHQTLKPGSFVVSATEEPFETWQKTADDLKKRFYSRGDVTSTVKGKSGLIFYPLTTIAMAMIVSISDKFVTPNGFYMLTKEEWATQASDDHEFRYLTNEGDFTWVLFIPDETNWNLTQPPKSFYLNAMFERDYSWVTSDGHLAQLAYKMQAEQRYLPETETQIESLFNAV